MLLCSLNGSKRRGIRAGMSNPAYDLRMPAVLCGLGQASATGAACTADGPTTSSARGAEGVRRGWAIANRT